MSLAPAARFTLGSARYESHAAGLRVTLALLPGVGSFRVTLPARAEVTCTAGDRAVLDLDGGEGSETVLTGAVQGVRRSLDRVEVLAGDASVALSAVRPAASYVGQAGEDVIAALAGEAAVSLGQNELSLPLASYAAHQRRTSAEHVAALARLGGAFATIDGDGTLAVRKRPEGPADAALLYGRELCACTVEDGAAPAPERVLIGNGPAGTVEAPDALRPSAERLPGSPPAAGKDALWEPAPMLRTPETASAGSRAASTRAAAAGRRIRATGFLLPKLRPGMVIEIQQSPGGLADGKWLLTRVTHQVPPGRPGTTRLDGETLQAAGGGGLGAALSAGASALGGLL